ncbi:hypothetical protein ACKKBG_A24130 [Auxenochlorella protothecoides x Auxenochlorella symbiontica]
MDAGETTWTPQQWSRLERNWRRVASTHNIRDLLTDPPCDDKFNRSEFFLGILLIAAGLSLLVGVLLKTMVLPFLDLPSGGLLYNLKQSDYYPQLIAATLPVTIMAVFVNWTCLKLYKHNS